ncbi:porin family protein [Candidatus Dependentiae bacterium]|nr:porin family protein [Candidatus Dependentiae bacterium]
MEAFKKILLISLISPLQAYHPCIDLTYYLRAQTGASFGQCSKIKVDTIIWDPSPQGYNAELGTAPIAGLEGGINFHEWISLGASVNFRSKYKYCKFQTSTSTSTPGFIGDKTRIFNLDNTSFMLNLTLNRTANSYGYEFDCFKLCPYVGFGIGWSRTTIYNFHSVRVQQITSGSFTTNQVSSIMSTFGQNHFAWDLEFGLNLTFHEDLSLSIGYRYYDAGSFRSNNFLIDTSASFPTPIQIPAWKGKLRANELVIQLGIEW